MAHNAPVTTELGIVPMGTANDFATGLGVPADPWEALQLALCTPAQPIDVGIVNEQVVLAPGLTTLSLLVSSTAAALPRLNN